MTIVKYVINDATFLRTTKYHDNNFVEFSENLKTQVNMANETRNDFETVASIFDRRQFLPIVTHLCPTVSHTPETECKFMDYSRITDILHLFLESVSKFFFIAFYSWTLFIIRVLGLFKHRSIATYKLTLMIYLLVQKVPELVSVT